MHVHDHDVIPSHAHRLGELKTMPESSRASFAPAARVVIGGHKDVVDDECQAFLDKKWAGCMGKVGVTVDDSGVKAGEV